jgi:oligopeptide/dipeptide ABC transporter ATP-binding protein
MHNPLIELCDLTKTYPSAGFDKVLAVDHVSLKINSGESVGLVGESGSGKSTIGLLISKLIPVSSGRIYFEGQDITDLSEKKMRSLRSDIQIVFQDPWGSINPRFPIRRTLSEPFILHTDFSSSECDREVKRLADRVQLPQSTLERYPHELSGGQLQRVSIARAIASKPRFLIMDEPTSSLDLSVRAGILELLNDIRRETGLTLLLISHDLDTVELMTERLIVLYLGRVAEMGRTSDVLSNPVHPYTQTLISSNLQPDPNVDLKRIKVNGEIPSPLNAPKGCLFGSRCPLFKADCALKSPPLVELSDSVGKSPNHLAACIRVQDFSFKIL